LSNSQNTKANLFLTIDIGNTRTKAALFTADGTLISMQIIETDELVVLQKLIIENQVQHLISTTSGKRNWLVSDLHVPGKNIELSHTTPLPIKILYSTPETLGRDRIASACGAHALYPNQNILVIDCGTCITFNVVLASGIFLGGNIAPGLHMRLNAMHYYTSRLPKVKPGWPEIHIGDSTVHAMQLGAARGIISEIEGMIRHTKNAFGAVSVVMTGGDAPFLAARLENQIFVEPELVVTGLFKITAFNVQLAY
jgi:type III pantothenate kinase